MIEKKNENKLFEFQCIQTTFKDYFMSMQEKNLTYLMPEKFMKHI